MFIQVGLHKYKVRGIVWISNHSILWRYQNLTDLHILWVVVTYWVQMLVVVEKNKHYPHQPALSLAILIVAAARKEAFVVEDHNAAFGLMQRRRLRV